MSPSIIVSIIIPCYNHGKYLQETINSLLPIINLSIHEVIIVNDGSTDEFTKEKLNEISINFPFTIINQKNKGLAGARNTGIQNANGKYILPLDSDNLLTDIYLINGVEVLENNNDIDIVYGKSKCFEESNDYLPTHAWSLQSILTYNFIDACTLIRKTTLDKIGGYDEKMPINGVEDWDLWINFSLKNHQFYYLESLGPVQHYRVLKNSMIRSFNKKNADDILDYLNKKYYPLLNMQSVDDFYFKKFNQNSFSWTAKLFIKKYFPTLYDYLIKKNKIRKYL